MAISYRQLIYVRDMNKILLFWSLYLYIMFETGSLRIIKRIKAFLIVFVENLPIYQPRQVKSSESSEKMAARSKSRFTFTPLWICLVLLRLIDSALNLPEDNPELLFAPKQLDTQRNPIASVVCTWKKNSHLRASLKRNKGCHIIPPCYWLLILAGDIELNPGPLKYPCSVCHSSVKNNQRGIFCNKCELWAHAKCCDVSVEYYNKLSKDGDCFQWFCKRCLLLELPFAIDDPCDNQTSPQLSSTTLNCTQPPPSQFVTCCCLNARSIANKALDLQALMAERKLDIIAITESFLSDDILDGELISGQYQVFRRDHDRHGGGVMLVTNNNVQGLRRYNLESSSELMWVELSLKPCKMLVGVFYNPPGNNLNALIQLQSSLMSIPKTSHVVLCGDFNVPNVNWELALPSSASNNSSANFLCDIVADFNLHQLVREPTRCNNILDLILTTHPDSIHNVEVADGLHLRDII